MLLNLSRDQMDRAAEIWLLARRWRDALAAAPDCHVVANADDPLIAWAASDAPHVTWVSAGQRWHDDSWCCPRCGSHLRRSGEEWILRRMHVHPAAGPVGAVRVEDAIDPTGRARPLELALPGRANQSNAVVALAVAEVFGVDVVHALRGLRDVISVAGRYTTVERRGVRDPAAAGQEPGGLAGGARCAARRRRNRSCSR